MNTISHNYLDVWFDYLKYVLPVNNVSFVKLIRPRYYNYYTDEIIASIDFNDDVVMSMQQIIQNNRQKFNEYIKDTSFPEFSLNR